MTSARLGVQEVLHASTVFRPLRRYYKVLQALYRQGQSLTHLEMQVTESARAHSYILMILCLEVQETC